MEVEILRLGLRKTKRLSVILRVHEEPLFILAKEDSILCCVPVALALEHFF